MLYPHAEKKSLLCACLYVGQKDEQEQEQDNQAPQTWAEALCHKPEDIAQSLHAPSQKTYAEEEKQTDNND